MVDSAVDGAGGVVWMLLLTWTLVGNLRSYCRFLACSLLSQFGHLAVVASFDLRRLMHSSVGWAWLRTPHLTASSHLTLIWLKRWHFSV